MTTAGPQAPSTRAGSGAAQAFSFLTVVGRGGGARPSPASFRWFPVVGAALGGALGLSWWGLAHVFPAAVAAAIVVAADLGLTGLLHFDGLLDAADGLFPHLSRERRLEVMAEPRVGAFAVVTAVAVLVARVAAISSIAVTVWWKPVLLLAALWAVSRSVMVLAMGRMRYAREGGIAAAFLGDGGRAGPSLASPLAAVVLGGVALCAWRLAAGIPVLAASLAGAGAMLLLAQRRIGGYTGDVLGAAGVLGETLGLLVASARW